MSEGRLFGFPPVFREDARVLILGSMPSVQSLKEQFYYAHPRNAFWNILADCFEAPLPRTIGEKIQLLQNNRLALWDAAASCERIGSLDSAIRAEIPNDFNELLRSCPGLRHIFFNGATAEKLYRKYNAENAVYGYRRLPSTSPAYTKPYAEKFEAWKQAFKEVNIL